MTSSTRDFFLIFLKFFIVESGQAKEKLRDAGDVTTWRTRQVIVTSSVREWEGFKNGFEKLLLKFLSDSKLRK